MSTTTVTPAFDEAALVARAKAGDQTAFNELVQHYATTSGRQVDDLDYYIILAKWKLAVVLEQGFQRAGDDEKLQAFGPIVLDLMQSAADMAESSDYSVLAAS